MQPSTITALVSLAVPISGSIGAWLHARCSRKVRLKIGPDELEIETQTMKDMEQLLKCAQEFQAIEKNESYQISNF
jgi:hypothetical protein